MKNSLQLFPKIILFSAIIFTAANLPAQTFTTLHSFAETEGTEPSDLISSNGILYGTTAFEGTNNYGAIYSINADGKDFRVLYSFSNSQSHALTLLGGTIYATTLSGGISNNGTICSVGIDGSNPKTIYQFAGAGNGAWPLSIITEGNLLYGTTEFGSYGGKPPLPSGGAILYSMDTNGNNFKILHTFKEGQENQFLTSADDVLFGTTGFSDQYETNAVIFSISANGDNYKDLYIFTNTLSTPTFNAAVRVIFSQGLLYGVGLSNQYVNSGAVVFSLNTNGSNFKILHNFVNEPELLCSFSNLLWGGTVNGGVYNGGEIFSMKTNGGNYNVLYNVPNNRNLSSGGGLSGLISDSNMLYGTTSLDGTNNFGSVFSFNPAPTIQSLFQSNENFNMTWNSSSNALYQLQYSTNLLTTNWFNFGDSLIATDTNLIFSDTTTNAQRFYRLIYQP